MKKEFIELDNGKVLFNWFGKYGPGLTIIGTRDQFTDYGPISALNYDKNKGYKERYSFLDITGESSSEVINKLLNLPTDSKDLNIYKGSFRINKKGTKIFDLTGDTHYLVSMGWGGSFNKTRGFVPESVKEEALFYKRASSNGGGVGKTYLVLPVGYRYMLSEDDI